MMQRNMDLVRMILLRLENPPSGGLPEDLGIKGYVPEKISYHVHIMEQEGLIEAEDESVLADSERRSMPTTMTWQGHEFLDLARDQDRWNRAKAIVAKVGGGPISIWVKILTDLAIKNVENATAQLK